MGNTAQIEGGTLASGSFVTSRVRITSSELLPATSPASGAGLPGSNFLHLHGEDPATLWVISNLDRLTGD
jgi:hypothetical protein